MAVNTIINKGAPANRVDIVFLGDGYTAGSIATTYYDHVRALTDYLFVSSAANNNGRLVEPFLRYKNFFNVHVVETVSQQAGADVPPENVFVNTALNSRYFFDGVTDRLLYVDDGVTNAVRNAALAGTGVTSEMQFVTVNSARYGGGGGAYAVYAGGNASALEVAVHEVAHSFAGLADEYGGFAGPYTGPEPTEVNVTKDPTGQKWARWLGYEDPDLGTVGAFNGGRYFNDGIYRPTNTSKMNVLNNPFDAISRETFILKFYDLVDPVDTFTAKGGPAGTLPGSVAVTNVFDFTIDTIDEAIIKQTWTIVGFGGNAALPTGTALDIHALNLQPGKIEIRARAFDDTPWVRTSLDKLEQTIVWDLTVAANRTLNGDGNANVLRGAFSNDTINGGAGGDTLVGYFGNDILNGGTNPEGATGQGDVMLGGAGDDTYSVDSGLDLVDEGSYFPTFGFGGTDTIVSTADFYWDIASVGEFLRVSEAVVDPGNDGVTIVGGVFNNTLIGHSKTDVIFGRGGSDTYRAGDGIDFMSLSTLGVPDVPGSYVANGVNTVIVEQRTTGPTSYDIVFEFESGRDKLNVAAYGFASQAAAFATGVNDGAGNSYFILGDGFDYLYMVGRTLAQLTPTDFVV